jgi:hypothetical protein
VRAGSLVYVEALRCGCAIAQKKFVAGQFRKDHSPRAGQDNAAA